MFRFLLLFKALVMTHLPVINSNIVLLVSHIIMAMVMARCFYS